MKRDVPSVDWALTESGGHEEGEDLVEEGVGSKLSGFVCDLSQCRLGREGGRVGGSVMFYFIP